MQPKFLEGHLQQQLEMYSSGDRRRRATAFGDLQEERWRLARQGEEKGNGKMGSQICGQRRAVATGDWQQCTGTLAVSSLLKRGGDRRRQGRDREKTQTQKRKERPKGEKGISDLRATACSSYRRLAAVYRHSDSQHVTEERWRPATGDGEAGTGRRRLRREKGKAETERGKPEKERERGKMNEKERKPNMIN